MTQRDRLKLLRAGFVILRRDYVAMKIRVFTGNGGWKVIANGFKSKADLDRQMEKYLYQENFVEDC